MYMPFSSMPSLPEPSMEIENDVQKMLPEDEYLKKPAKPSSTPAKKKRVMSQAQLDNLKKAREISAQKRKAKKEAEKLEKQRLKEEKKKGKKKKLEPIKEEVLSDSSSSDDDEEERTPTPVAKPKPIPIPQSDNMEERIYNRLRMEKQQRREVRLLKKQKEKEKKEYEESIRADERNRLLAMVEEEEQRNTIVPKPKAKINTDNLLKPSKWDDLFKPRDRRFPF